MLHEERVLELARGWLDAILPPDYPGQFFLAGGAFKTALHGRPPHDLDLWPSSDAGRESLLAALRAHGAVVVRENPPYQTVLRNGPQVVEVACKCEPAVLRERLERADLGLAAVGVEWRAGRLRAEIHPLATTSAAAHEVRIMRPVMNWKYALATIERGRRYAKELGFSWSQEDDSALWSLFEAQSVEMQHGMIDRLRRVGRSGEGVLEEAVRRCGRAARITSAGT